MQNADEKSGQWKWVGLRLIWVFLALLFVALTLNFLAYVIGEGVAALSISLTLLFGIPYILGACGLPDGAKRETRRQTLHIRAAHDGPSGARGWRIDPS